MGLKSGEVVAVEALEKNDRWGPKTQDELAREQLQGPKKQSLYRKTNLGKEYFMTRGSNQITALYENIVSSSQKLGEEMQRRILTHAKLTKNVGLAADLAKRTDTVDEVDSQLAAWDAAKVQASWYARPNRPVAQVIEHLERENRITVLEVLAGIEGLGSEVYKRCAKKNSARVAFQLLANPAAGDSERMEAAETLAREVETLSYERRAKLREALCAVDMNIAHAYITTAKHLPSIRDVLQGRDTLDEKTAVYVCELAIETLKTAVAGWKEERKSPKSNSHYSWNSASYVGDVDLVIEILGIVHQHEYTKLEQVERLYAGLKELLGSISKEKKRSHDEEQVCNSITGALESFGVDVETMSTSANQVKNAKTDQDILEILQKLETKDKLDNLTLISALLNPNISTKGALFVGSHIRWYGVDITSFIRVKKSQLSSNTIGALMTSSWIIGDDDIDKFTDPHTPQDLWRGLVAAHLAEGDHVPLHVLESRHCDASIIPQLPFALFSQTGLPEWLVSGMATYLAENLTTPAQWDGFEVLARKHVGTVEQLVRGSRLATRKANGDK